MNLSTSILALAAASVAGMASAQDMTIVSWGGAYSESQKRAYHEPYSANTGVNIINDDSSAEAVAKLRAMNEAGNITWDVVDVVAADAIRLCDEGLALEINADEQLAPAPDGTPASADFGDLIVSDCFIPQIVYSTTFGYRTDLVGDTPPTDVCAVFDTETYPGMRSLEKRPINNMEWALICDGVAFEDVYDVLETEEGQEQALAKLATIEEQNQPVAMLWDAQVFDLDGWIIPTGLSEERTQQALDYIYFATDTQRLADQAKYISYGPARASSAPLVGTHADLGIEMAPHMPTDPENSKRTFLYNYEFWADYRDDIDAKFQAWLSQ